MDLAGVIAAVGGDAERLRFTQATVAAWDTVGGTASVTHNGAVIPDIPALSGINAVTLAPGDVVGMLGWQPEGGLMSWFIIGKIVTAASASDLIISGGGITVTGGNTVSVTDGTSTVTLAPDAVVIGAGATNATLSIGDVSGTSIVIEGAPVAIQYATSSASANVVMTTANPSRVMRSTSTRRAKTDVRDYRIGVADVLRLRPVSWIDRAERAQNPATRRRHVGLIAEDVHEAGLCEYVDYDAEGRPVAVTYDRLCAALIESVRELSARVTALETGTAPPPRPVTRTVIEPRQER